MTGNGAPGGIRTPDQWLRKPLLYPAELRAHERLRVLQGETRGARRTRSIAELGAGAHAAPADGFPCRSALCARPASGAGDAGAPRSRTGCAPTKAGGWL